MNGPTQLKVPWAHLLTVGKTQSGQATNQFRGPGAAGRVDRAALDSEAFGGSKLRLALGVKLMVAQDELRSKLALWVKLLSSGPGPSLSLPGIFKACRGPIVST